MPNGPNIRATTWNIIEKTENTRAPMMAADEACRKQIWWHIEKIQINGGQLSND